jgi:hypothetical protein
MAVPSPDDSDSPWKETLDHFLAQFLDFFFPAIHQALDWQRGYESLDKELHQITRDASVGKRLADKLFKVWRNDGTEAWLLIHVELQSHREKEFSERMFTYWYRIRDLYKRPVVSLALLCDADPAWKPEAFRYNVWGCEVVFRFLCVKLLELRSQEERLEADRNPIAAVILAQLKALETRQMPVERQTWKLRLIKGLYERGLKADQVRRLFRLIDWLLALPAELEDRFRQDVYQFEEERKMPYITSIERLAKQEGVQQGLIEGIDIALRAKFGARSRQLLHEIRAIEDVDKLRKLGQALIKAKSPDDIHRLLRR